MAIYNKPDVEVYQQFRIARGTVKPAVLQSCIVGPLYQIFKDEVIGSYDNEEHLYYFPHALKPGAIVDQKTLKVRVVLYGEEYVVAKSDLVTTGTDGIILNTDLFSFIDNSKDFLSMNITVHTDIDSRDGDYLRIPVGPNAGYYKILEIVDSHTLRLGTPLQQDATNENYEIRSAGYILEEESSGFSLRITPELGFFGNVTVSFKALRTDRTRPFEWTYDDLIDEVGEDQITPENPLAYGASLALSVIGTNGFVLAMPILQVDTTGYLTAFEVLENYEVYAITVLTHNMQVAQYLKSHVNAMSTPTEKKERIGLIAMPFHDEITKVGYVDVTDGETGASGINSTEIVLVENASLAADNATNEYEFTGIEPTRATIHFDTEDKNIANGAVVKYLLESDLSTWVTVQADTDPYHVVIMAPAGDSINSISYQSPSGTSGNVNIIGYATVDEAQYTEYDYMLAEGQIANVEPVSELIDVTATHIAEARIPLADKPLNPSTVKVAITNIQNFIYGDDYIVIEDSGTWYVSWAGRNMEDVIAQGHTVKISYIKGDSITKIITPTAGHQALKIRAWDATPSTFGEKPETWEFPSGMVLHVITESEIRELSRPGTYVFDRDILAIYKTVSVESAITDEITDISIELMILPDAGTYSRNKFIDNDAKFRSVNNISIGDILVILNGQSAGEYRITNILSDTELTVDTQFNVFESGLIYKIKQGDVSKRDLAKWYGKVSASFGDRRIVNTYCPVLGRSPDGVNVELVPGYFYNCVLAGMIQSVAPQAGLTNMAVPGFTQVFYVSDYFTEAQLNEIAAGGTLIIMQNSKWAVPFIRHQLTTDMSMIEKRELSCVKALDYLAKTGRETLRPYIGRFLINEITMSTLYSATNALLAKAKADGLINSGNVVKIYVDPNERDTVVICVEIELPIPLNKIKLFIYV